VVGVSLSKTALSLAAGSSDAVSLRAHYSDGSQQDATAQATWTSSAGTVATVTAGTVTGVAQGSATVTATYTVEGTPYTAGTAVTVTEPVLPLALAGNATIAFGGSATFTVSRPAPAPRDIVVTLTPGGNVIVVPPSVVMARGHSSAAFTVTGSAVGSGVLVASAENHTAASVPVSVVPLGPTIAAISPTQGPAQTTVVTISGTDFGANPSDNTVSFAGAEVNGAPARAPAVVLAASSTQLTVRVPAAAVTGAVQVSTALGTALGPVFTVTQEQAVDFSASPASVVVYQGASSTLALSLASTGPVDYTGLMQLSVSGLPAGVSARFAPTHLARGQNGTLTLTAAAAAPVTEVPITLTATNVSGGLVAARTATVRVSVQAAAGVTGVKGRFVTPEGAGLAAFRVAVQDAGGNLLAQTVSDAAGNFLLTGLTPGSITLRLDGTAANPLYPIWPYTFVHPGNSVITLADWVIAPPPADDKFTPIANAAQDQIVTDARFPGLEITLPAGVTITGYDGVVKTRIAVERMTPDKLPTPPPPIRTESIYQLYFGTPMGGIPSAPIPVKVPNDLGLEPGETTELWYFDGVPMGGSGEWKVGGTGTVSADGKYIVTNPGEGIPRFCGVCGLFCFADNQDRAPNPPCDDCEPGAPNQGEGNPITLATGQALATATDLVLDGDPPIVISRRFNPFDAFGFVANYTQSLGVNWTFNYDVALMPFNDGGSSIRMVMPGNRRFNFAHSGGGEYRASTGPLMMQGHRFRRVGGTSPTAGGTPVPLLVSPAAGSATAGISALAPADVDNCFFSSSAGNYELKQKNGEVWTFSPFPAATPVRINGGCLYFLTEIRDARGRTLTIQRGANGALARITSSSGRWVQFFYSNGVVSSLQDSLGRTVTYTHVHLTETGSANGVGGFGGLRQSIGVSGGAGVSAGVIAIRDDARVALRRLASATTPDGTYAYTYEDDPPEFRLGGPRFIAAGGGTGALFSAAANVGTGTVDACPMSLSGARIASLTRPDLPGAVVNSYGPSGRVHRQTWPDGTVRHFRYELLGACVYHTATPTQRCLGAACPKEDSAATAAAGWRFVGGRVVATTVADAVGELYTQRFNSNRVAIEYIDALGQSWKYERDANNRIVRSVDPLGRVTRYTNDENGNRTRIVDAANRVTEITYTLTGLPKPATVRRYRADGTSVFWQFGFDAATGNLTSARDPVGNITTLSYAATTHLLRSVRSAGGRTTSFEHDSRGELVRLTDPLGRDLGYEYDGAGRNTKVINGLGQETAFAYNARDQLTAITDAHGGVTQFAYDANNRLQSVTDPLNQTLERYGYTAASRLSSVLDGFNRETRYSYDARGLVSELLDRQGQRIVFERDIAGRITRVSRPDADTTYRYDAVGRLIEIAEGANRLTVDYDVLDRPVRELHQQGDLQVTIEHDWDDLDRRSQRRLSAVGPAGSLPAQTTDYAYDDAGRITRITQQGQLATYVWDADHRLTDKTLPNGVAVRYTYDAAGQVTEIAYRRTDGTLIERIAYQYDAAGRRVQKDTLVAPSVDETPFAATYDAGNRLSSITLAPGTPAAATYTLSYDPNGNLIEKRNSADATDLTTYTWDSRNRLVALSAPGLAAAFVYDALGRRTERRITRAGEPELVTQFVYDGLQAVGEIQPQRGAVPERNDALITGLLLDEVIARVSSGANGTDPQARTYLTDALGSVLLQLRGDQTVQSTTGYSPYGQSSTAGDAAGNRIEFTGRENDATGLLFYRARYYDPVLKRFISEDPIGLAAGTHLYGYVDGNPVLYTDPTGNVPFVAPIAWGYVRCLAQCTAWSAAGSLQSFPNQV
jgi:RHS repeat-associated protein